MIFSFLFSFLLTHTVQGFVCPDFLITPESGPIGVIPISRVGLSVIPANYDCAYHFLIYPGWALHFSISTHYDQFLGDNITFTDNLGEVHALPTPNQHIEEWSSAPSAILHIKTMSNTSQMFAIYEFVNVEKKYQHVMVPTGEYFALGDMKNRYYTFHSEAMDRIVLNLAVKNTQDYDTLLEFLFVYDGGDVKNCPMIGKLSNFLKKKKVSTWHNITIVNFYDVKSHISSETIGQYKAILTSRNQQTTGELFDASDQGAAYTWICSDCKNFYWTVLKFHKSATTIPKAYIELRSLSPTHNTSTLLNYTFSTSIERNFPQLIPTRMFTMINHNSGIAVTLDTSVNKSMTQKWLKPFDGRKGTIFSPSLWDPNTSPSFSYQFEDHNQKFMFGVNVKDVRIAAPGDSLTIKTGPTASSNFSYKEFVSDHTEFWTRRESKGNFMQIAYDGWDRKSMAIVSFDMKQINSGSSWDDTIAQSAQQFAEGCPDDHSKNEYGENLYWGWTSEAVGNLDPYGVQASKSWEKEFQDYGWLTRTLTQASFDSGIGHATQMAWSKTNKIGCGAKSCGVDPKNGMNKVTVVCQYKAKGNTIDEPIYAEGTTCSSCPTASTRETDSGLCA